MRSALAAFLADEIERPVTPAVAAAARLLAARLGGVAVLFYGSVLRTGDLDGVLDFYVLTAPSSPGWRRGMGMRWLWPDVSFQELTIANRIVRAKVATVPIDIFEQAAAGAFIDTTIWTRFVQPSALAWRADPATARRVIGAIASAAVTAGSFSAALGPVRGAARDYWTALFRQTYDAELRVERPGRETDILSYDPARYDALLPLAWTAAGIAFETAGSTLAPSCDVAQCRDIVDGWMFRMRFGKALNLARLVKAAFTFDGAARYGLWKVERHTGVRIALTPWRERHPILAAPGVVWHMMRARAL